MVNERPALRVAKIQHMKTTRSWPGQDPSSAHELRALGCSPSGIHVSSWTNGRGKGPGLTYADAENSASTRAFRKRVLYYITADFTTLWLSVLLLHYCWFHDTLADHVCCPKFVCYSQTQRKIHLSPTPDPKLWRLAFPQSRDRIRLLRWPISTNSHFCCHQSPEQLMTFSTSAWTISLQLLIPSAIFTKYPIPLGHCLTREI